MWEDLVASRWSWQDFRLWKAPVYWSKGFIIQGDFFGDYKLYNLNAEQHVAVEQVENAKM